MTSVPEAPRLLHPRASSLRWLVWVGVLVLGLGCLPWPAFGAERWATFELGDLEFDGHLLRGVTVALAPGAERVRVDIGDAGIEGPTGRIGRVRIECDPVTIRPTAVDCIGGRLHLSVDGADSLVVAGRIRVRRRVSGFEIRCAALATPIGSLRIDAVTRSRGWRVSLGADALDLARLNVPGLTGVAALDAQMSMTSGRLTGAVTATFREAGAESFGRVPARAERLHGSLRLDLDGEAGRIGGRLVGVIDGGQVHLAGTTLSRRAWPLRAEAGIERRAGLLRFDDIQAFGSDGSRLQARGEWNLAGRHLALEGTALSRLDGGDLVIPRFRLEHDGTTVFEADARLAGWPLADLARAFGFATITGRVDGVVTGLRLVDGLPARFDAELVSAHPHGPGERRHVSRDFIERLRSGLDVREDRLVSRSDADLGQAVRVTSGVADGQVQPPGRRQAPAESPAESPGGVRAADWMSYARIGLGCRYRDGICRLSGLADLEEGYLVMEAVDDGPTLAGVRRHLRLPAHRTNWPWQRAAADGQE